ncbi:hypothetical protein PoB_000783800 [Plakobranchus ocellatus]|uniref:Uncharacterized protein n=1 Tax=Plakobranchus ocellatus TaxID=259542 RepID=A0AAV3YFT7_9GAST|nr:hypothetical protein PoB_000783800 [Plakobranchus ocellatus]
MATSRSRKFTATKILELFYTAGSEDDDYSSADEKEDDREDNRDVLSDIPRLDLDRLEREATRSQSSIARSTSRSLGIVRDIRFSSSSASESGQSRDPSNVSSNANSITAMSDADDTDSETEFYPPGHQMYEMDTEVNEPPEVIKQLFKRKKTKQSGGEILITFHAFLLLLDNLV